MAAGGQKQPPNNPSPNINGKSPSAPGVSNSGVSNSATSNSGASSTTDANPFPEAVSEKAAEEAQQKKTPHPQYSSSQSSAIVGGAPESGPPAPDPARAKKDIQVGDYYMDSGDYRGAYLRFKDAVKYDQGDLDAVFGLAQSARKIGRYDEAARNFRVYLAVESKGSKAKEARKALREMAGK